MAMITYFSAAVLLLSVGAAPVTDTQGMIRRQAQPHTQQSMSIVADGDLVTAQPTAAAASSEIQVVSINDKGASSVMQPDYGDGDGDGDGDGGSTTSNVCSDDKKFTPSGSGSAAGSTQWKGKCFSLAACQALAAAGTGFNWWPKKGGCRTNTGDYTAEDVGWTTIGGDHLCTPPDGTATTPLCSECSSLSSPACRSDESTTAVTAATVAPTAAATQCSTVDTENVCPTGQCATAATNEPCSTTKSFTACDTAHHGGATQWQGRCKTFEQCRDLCIGTCTGFNWWPVKGGCRTNTGRYSVATVGHATIGGLGCTYLGPTSPTSDVCP